MKKSLIYTSAASLALLAGVATTVLLNNASAETNGANSTLESVTDPTTLGTALSGSKNETVYVITDAAGTPTKTFLGNILETSESDLPVTLKVTYTLDGREISASDLAGQSGHVKITFKYTSIKTYQGKYVPFLALTGLSLDDTKFKNIKVDNGKIIEQSNSQLIAGYSVAGLNENLGTDILPSGLIIEADVTDFELGSTYTLATDELFAEIDTSKLSTVDDLISSINQLGDGISQILDGATQLDDGIGQLASGIKELQSGATALNSGASDLASGASELNAKVESELVPSATSLSSGLTGLSSNSVNITNGAMQIFQALLDTTSYNIYKATGATVSLTPANYATILQGIITDPTTPATAATELIQTKALLDQYLNNFYTKLATYTGTVDYIASLAPGLSAGAEQLASGTAALSAGADQLVSGTTALESGISQLASGSTELQSGSQALKDGIATFKRDGIDQLVNLANNDLASFTANLRSTVSAAKSYHSYKSTSAESVKFIFKTPSFE